MQLLTIFVIGTITFIKLDKALDMSVPDRPAVISQYWCWRAQHCLQGDIVCTRDRRQDRRQWFHCACDMYRHNCQLKHDFTATDPKICSHIPKPPLLRSKK
ncbi:uncharacterized protein LOC121735939 isoform X1 [Aricia agestis]|uniref:uncharacterized protein LOC121735939 isoform X1 n=1 Tax=Aricia agestis TaxID=91739 RepID=UPI001C202991|nr:uncharacterized protein LOC121735939 isoform X1 [Aricia agestis]